MKGATTVETTNSERNGFHASGSSPQHGAPELISVTNDGGYGQPERTVDDIEGRKRGWFAYFKTKDFYIVLVLGYVVSFRRKWLYHYSSVRDARNSSRNIDRFWHYV